MPARTQSLSAAAGWQTLPKWAWAAERIAQRFEVFLAACLSGAGDSDTTGFAQGLLARGIPLVLAMQTRVSD